MVEGDGTCLCEPGYQDVVDSNGQNTCIPVSQCDRSPALCCPAGLHWNTATHSCDVDNQTQTPKLKIEKTVGNCYTVVGTPVCDFLIVITNVGTAPYTGEIVISDSNSAGIQLGYPYIENGYRIDCNSNSAEPICQVKQASNPNNPITLNPNSSITITWIAIPIPPGSQFVNCAKLTVPDQNEPPSCKSVGTPLVTSGCPNGAQRNSDGNCPTTTTTCTAPNFLVNGMCCNARSYQVGTCGRPPPTSGCPDGAARNSDGNCPTPPPQLGCPPGTVPTNDGTSCSSGGNPQVCQRPKIMSDGACVCPEGTVGNDCHKPQQCDSDEFLGDNGKCVERPTRKTRKPRRHKPSQPSGETGKSPPIELNIGIGIGGGSHGGGHPTRTPRMPTRGGG